MPKYLYTQGGMFGKKSWQTMALPAYTNIPILGALPDIPAIYLENPALRFIIDAALLCLILGSILAPLSVRVVGKVYGKRVGAIIGIVLGLSAAFALRAAGITLLEYWLTTVVTAAVAGGFLYMALNKLFHGKFRIISAIIALLIGWMIIDSWFAVSKQETVRNIFGFISLLAPVVFLVLLVYFLTKLVPAGARGAPPEGPPPAPGRPVGVTWVPPAGGAAPPVPGAPPTAQPPFVPEATTGPAPEPTLQAGPTTPQGAAVAAEQKVTETRKEATQAEKETAVAEQAAGWGEKVTAELEKVVHDMPTKISELLGRSVIAIEDRDKLIADLDALLAQIEKLRPRVLTQLSAMSRVRNLLQKIEETIALHNNMTRTIGAWDLTKIEEQVKALKSPELEAQLRQLKEQITALQKSIGMLNEIIARLEKHKQFIQSTQFEMLYAKIAKRYNTIPRYIRYARSVIATATGPAALRKSLNDVRNTMNVIATELASMTKEWEDLKTGAGYTKSVITAINGELKHYDELYKKLVPPSMDVITKSIKALEEAIVTKQAERPPAAPAELATLEAIQKDIASQHDLLADVRKKITNLVSTLGSQLNAITFKPGKERTWEAQAKVVLGEAAGTAKVEVAELKAAEASAADAISLLHKAAQSTEARLAVVAETAERNRLTEWKRHLGIFETCEADLLNFLKNLDQQLVQQVTAAVAAHFEEKKVKQMKGSTAFARLAAWLEPNLKNLDKAVKTLEAISWKLGPPRKKAR